MPPPARCSRFFLVVCCITCCTATSHAQSFTLFSEWRIPTPDAGPRNLAPSGNGVFFTELNAGKIGFLDMNAGVITEWTLSGAAFPHGLAVEGQKVVFTEGNANLGGPISPGRIAVLDTGANLLTEWNIPQITAAIPEPLQVSWVGATIFFSDANQGAIGMLDTSTNRVTQWLLPGAPATRTPNGIVTVAGQNGATEVWIADPAAQKITQLDPASNSATEWPIPDAAVEHLDVLDGVVAFADLTHGKVGTLNPALSVVREFTVPTTDAQPLYVAWLSSGVFAFTEYSGSKIGTLQTAIGPFSQIPVARVPTLLVPRTQTTIPISTLVAPIIRTAVAPTFTPAVRSVTGGFIEYPLPALSSQPAGIAISGGAILFTEFSAEANSIGRLNNRSGQSLRLRPAQYGRRSDHLR